MLPRCLMVAFAMLGGVYSACAHGIAGNRFFPGTMTFDDPAVADEFLVQQSGLQHPVDSDSGINMLDNSLAWSFVRLLTPELAIGINSGWIHRRNGYSTQAGFDQTSVTIKRLMYKDELHETLMSASLTWGIGGSGVQGDGANKPNTVLSGSPLIGKGFGDWPRQLGVVTAVRRKGGDYRRISNQLGLGQLRVQFHPRGNRATGGPERETLHWGFAIEYSTLYLTSRFTPGMLPKEEPLHQLITLVEFTFDSPRGK